MGQRQSCPAGFSAWKQEVKQRNEAAGLQRRSSRSRRRSRCEEGRRASGHGGEIQAKPRIARSSHNIRTGLEADAIATALIDNLHCLQGTGNMKFAMNGALTIGTLDGANIEIRDAVGEENFFLFGLTTEEVERRKARGYEPRGIYESNPELRETIDLIDSGFFSDGDRGLFHLLIESLLTHDDYMLLADYQSYVDCQQRVSWAYADQNNWTHMSILNTARVGRFSSDRSIREYCRDIWNIQPTVSGKL
jgi:Carbohydrate phosphorylase